MNEQNFVKQLKARGYSRRDFLKFCTVMAASMGLPLSAGEKIAAAVENPTRPPVIWISGQGCTGCTESLLRTTHPSLETLILEMISLDYNETLNAGAGHQAEKFMHDSIEKNSGKFILVVEGSIPTKDGGIYCQIAGKPFVDIVKETAGKAAATIAIGSCAAWGGIPSAEPNPTGAKGVKEVLPNATVMNIPGCPSNPYNFTSAVAYYLTYNKLPELDDKARPKFAFSRLIHENCERRPHFDAGRFAEEFGDEGHKQGYCLYKLGCKGPVTYNNCSILGFNDVGSWPVKAGHPCFGCSEEGVGFHVPQFVEADLKKDSLYTPAATPADITYQRGGNVTATAAGLVGLAVGVAAGAGVVASRRLKSEEETGNL